LLYRVIFSEGLDFSHGGIRLPLYDTERGVHSVGLALLQFLEATATKSRGPSIRAVAEVRAQQKSPAPR
jgi:hypothetical protein